MTETIVNLAGYVFITLNALFALGGVYVVLFSKEAGIFTNK